jgi:hypothetical protein
MTGPDPTIPETSVFSSRDSQDKPENDACHTFRPADAGRNGP